MRRRLVPVLSLTALALVWLVTMIHFGGDAISATVSFLRF